MLEKCPTPWVAFLLIGSRHIYCVLLSALLAALNMQDLSDASTPSSAPDGAVDDILSTTNPIGFDTSSEAASLSEGEARGEEKTLLWVLIAIVVAVVLFLILLALMLVRRRRRQSEGAGPSAERANVGAGPPAERANVGAGPSAERANVGAGPPAERANVGAGPPAERASVGAGPPAEGANVGAELLAERADVRFFFHLIVYLLPDKMLRVQVASDTGTRSGPASLFFTLATSARNLFFKS
jgi:hypothetical protein